MALSIPDVANGASTTLGDWLNSTKSTLQTAVNGLLSHAPAVVTVTATATIADTTQIQQVNAAGATTQTLPTALAQPWGCITVKNLGAGAVTVAAPSGQTIETGTTLAQFAARTYYLDGTVWRVRA